MSRILRFLFMCLHYCCSGVTADTNHHRSNSTYAPGRVPCPNEPLIRRSDSLLPDELDYVDNRHKRTGPALEKFIRRINIPGLDADDIFAQVDSSDVNIGLAFSGGGLRALFTGAGALSAMDDRVNHTESTITSTAYTCITNHESHLGGLLQSSTYIAGLSGGGWLIGSLLFNNIDPVPKLVHSSQIWDFQTHLLFGNHFKEAGIDISGKNNSIKYHRSQEQWQQDSNVKEPEETGQFIGSSGDMDLNDFDSAATLNTTSQKHVIFNNLYYKDLFEYYQELHAEVLQKHQAGFRTSLTDYWSRALSRKLISPQGDGGKTWSDITNLGFFKRHEFPYPLLLAVASENGENMNSTTSTIVEISPYEFGSWNPKINHFIKLEYLGSETEYSSEKKDRVCYKGLDNAAFILGTSSSLFNDVLYYYGRNIIDTSKGVVLSCVRNLLEGFGFLDNDYYRQFARYYINPFLGLRTIENNFTRAETLHLTDGGADGQNLPLEPLLIPDRELDVIIAIDSTSDIDNYPNGTAVFRPTWRYHGTNISLNIAYPVVPSEKHLQDMLHEPVEHRTPLFFGCDPTSYKKYDGCQEQKQEQEEYGDADNSEETPGGYQEEDYFENGDSDYQENEDNYYYNGDDQFAVDDGVDDATEFYPLLVYIPNSYYSYPSNISTMTLKYSTRKMLKVIENGYEVMTQGHSSSWTKCLGCAVMLRSFQKTHITPPLYCNKCYVQYCID